MMLTQKYKVLIPFYAFYTVLTVAVCSNAFFWDTVQLASRQAHWFFENNFQFGFLPHEIDSGHPPTFGAFLAIVWKVFGKELWISHVVMLPFLIGIVNQSYELVKKFLKENYIPYAMLVLLADPTLLSQSTLVSPDIVLIFFLFLSLNYLLEENYLHLTFSLIPLGMISLRGMMHVAILFFVAIVALLIIQKNFSWKKFIRISGTFLPVTLIACVWLFLHYNHTGWIGYHENSPWRDSFASVSFQGFVRNVGIMLWRLIDFGRIFIWALLVPVTYLSYKRKKVNSKSYFLFLLFIIPVVVLSPNLLTHSNLLGHRYLLLLYLSAAILLIYQLTQLWPNQFKKISVVLFVLLLAGNFLVYGRGISQGWDGSLAHYPYYKMREEMVAFIKENNIDPGLTGTGFPNKVALKYIDLSDGEWKFAERDLAKNKYVLYSNVYNEFTNEDLRELQTWSIIKKLESPTVIMILYRKPNQ